MKYHLRATTAYVKDYKKAVKHHLPIGKLQAVVAKLANGEALPHQNKDHALSGNLIGLRDCHIESDWVLLYFYSTADELVLTLTDTGTHADLF